MVYNTPSGWQVFLADKRVKKEIAKLADDVQADFLHIVDMIQNYGPENVHEPHIKHLQGKLWEMRMRGRDGIARAAYVTAHEKRVVVLHAFVKKTQHAPQGAIELALKRAKELGYL